LAPVMKLVVKSTLFWCCNSKFVPTNFSKKSELFVHYRRDQWVSVSIHFFAAPICNDASNRVDKESAARDKKCQIDDGEVIVVECPVADWSCTEVDTASQNCHDSIQNAIIVESEFASNESPHNRINIRKVNRKDHKAEYLQRHRSHQSACTSNTAHCDA